MNCGGKYKYERKVYKCGKEWTCVHYTFRTKKQQVVISKTKDCEHWKDRYSEQFRKQFLNG